MAIPKVFSTHPVNTVFVLTSWFVVYFFYFFFLFSKSLRTFPFFKQVELQSWKARKTLLCKSAAVSPNATCFNSSQYLQPAAKQEHPEGFLSLSEESV